MSSNDSDIIVASVAFDCKRGPNKFSAGIHDSQSLAIPVLHVTTPFGGLNRRPLSLKLRFQPTARGPGNRTRTWQPHADLATARGPGNRVGDGDAGSRLFCKSPFGQQKLPANMVRVIKPGHSLACLFALSLLDLCLPAFFLPAFFLVGFFFGYGSPLM